MSKTWVCSDHHLGHKNIIKFTDQFGKKIRDFQTIEEHDECIIQMHNAFVNDNDRVYFLGDVVINRKNLPLIGKMKGRKVLIKGNHDIFKLEDYASYFDDVRAYKMIPKEGIILSHIPVHAGQLHHPFYVNVHGHIHDRLVTKIESRCFGLMKAEVIDQRYVNVCMEKINYTPVELESIYDIVDLVS